MTRESFRQYLFSFLMASVIFLFLSFYLFLRRGYYDLYIINKVLAGTSTILLGFVLLLGPFSRLYQIFDRFLIYRKELGIIAFFFALIHGLASFFFLPSHFSFPYFQKNFAVFWLGFSGLLVLTFLFLVSFEKIIEKIGRPRWWSFQVWGVRLAACLIFLHLFLMKYPGWIKWLQIGGSADLKRPFLPPASLLVGLFGFFVFSVRIFELLGEKLARFLMILLTSFFLTILGSLFVRGIFL